MGSINLESILRELDNKLEELPDYLSGYAKEFNFEGGLEKCEANSLKTLIEFLYVRMKENTERKDFKTMIKLVDKYLTGIQVSHEFNRHRDYVRQLVICLTNPEKKTPKNNFGGRPRFIDLTKEEKTFVKRKPNKIIEKEDKVLSIGQRMLKSGLYK